MYVPFVPVCPLLEPADEFAFTHTFATGLPAALVTVPEMVAPTTIVALTPV